MDHPSESGIVQNLQPPTTTNWTIDISDVRTVKVSNVAPSVSERDIYEFFSFSGEIQYIEMQGKDAESAKDAFVTFIESQGADTAALLTGATISGYSVTVTPFKDYQLPPNAVLLTSEPKPVATDSAVNKAEDVVSTMLAKGFVLGKDALNKAKAFDEKHQLTTNASATVASLDRRMGLSRTISIGTSLMNEKVKEMDERFQVSEKTRSALAAAEQKASIAGSAIMSNRWASWVATALTAVSKAAEEVGAKTMEKVEKATEGERKGSSEDKEKAITTVSNEAANNTGNESPTIPVISVDENNQTVRLG